MIKSVFIIWISLFSLVHLLPIESSGQTVGSYQAERSILLERKLKDIGEKYDLYFTLETGLISGDRAQSLEGQEVPTASKTTGLRNALERLRKSIPNLTYEYDRNNSRIVHIIDARLRKEKGYAMEKMIDSIEFEGFPVNLVNTVARKGINISASGSLSTTEALGVDFGTRLIVKEKNKRVRDILTNSIPLKGRGRILWIARTELGNGNTTFVRYLK